MKLINKIKNNLGGFIIGGIIFGSISITIASQILATQVSYTNEKSEANVTSVDEALTELYGLAEECKSASSSGSAIQYKGKDAVAVYLDPTGNATNCSSSNFTSTTETKSGCMRFWIYAEDSEYKYAILDHNTTKSVYFYAAQSQVKQDTASWNPNYQARNIRADELFKITENDNSVRDKSNWQINGGSSFMFHIKDGSTGGWDYGWLFDRTFNCKSSGCETDDSKTSGYWTSDFYDSRNAWSVSGTSHTMGNGLNDIPFGVRPVIQIKKS